eukprot:1636193-Amphidinium_carterae.2
MEGFHTLGLHVRWQSSARTRVIDCSKVRRRSDRALFAQDSSRKPTECQPRGHEVILTGGKSTPGPLEFVLRVSAIADEMSSFGARCAGTVEVPVGAGAQSLWTKLLT